MFFTKNKMLDTFENRVVHFYLNEGGSNKTKTWRHFKKEGIKYEKVKYILRKYEKTGSGEKSKIPGRPVKVSTAKVVKEIEGALIDRPNLSMRNGAQKFKMSKSQFHRIKSDKLGLKTYKKVGVPKVTEKQKKTAKKNCRKIYRQKAPGKILLIDDETYVPSDPHNIPGTQYFHCKSKADVPDEFKFKYQEKFPKKYLVWQCLDETGNVSSPFVTQGSMNGDVYLKECFKKILLPFIKKHHKIENVLLWMDMASCHYKGTVTEWLEQNGIDYVTKDDNAPSVPIARPIEKFWALVKAEYKKRKDPAKNVNGFRRIWQRLSKQVAETSAQKLMSAARRNLRLIGYKGVTAPYQKL